MWIVYNTETGQQIGDWHETAPEPADGEAMERVPGSAIGPQPLTMWSATARGFVDVPLVDGPRMGTMLTAAEIEALVNHADAAVRAIPLRWLLLIAFGMPQRVNSPLHISTANGMLAAGVLTQARHAQFLAGEPVQ